MLQVSKLVPQGQGLAPVLLRRAATITLEWDVRQKSRFDTESSDGHRVGVFLPCGTLVRGGDVLITQDGSLLRVVAAQQPVLKITACTAHDHGHHHAPSFDLMRAAYHLGKHHVPIELRADHLKIEPDRALADMLRAMHLTVAEVLEPFEPEGHAHATDHGAGHSHGHAHDHAHEHGHNQCHGHDHHGHNHPDHEHS